MSQAIDAIVVGGGATGALIALLLGRLGLAVQVVEKKPVGRYSPQWVALSHYSEGLLKDYLPALDLKEEAFIQTVEVSVRGKWGYHRIHAGDLKIPHLGRVLPMAALERHLQSLACDCKTVSWAQPVEFQRARLVDEGWVVETSTGILKAPLLIMADGAQSSLAEHLGITYSTHNYRYPVWVFRAKWTKPHEGVAFERFLEEGTLALLPVGTHETIGVCSLSPSFELTPSQVETWMHGRLGLLKNLHKMATLNIRESIARAQVGGRLVLLGNAAHTLHPIAAQGFNLSVRDAFILAEVIKKAQGKDMGCSDLLQEYYQLRLADQHRVAGVTHQLAEGVSEGHLPSLLKSLGLQFSRLPGIRGMVARMGLGL